MRAVLPGRPESRPQALSTGFWDSRNIITYISGNALSILQDPQTILQTIYDDDETPLEAVAFDEVSGKIATCTRCVVRVYAPFGQQDGLLKWAQQLSFAIPEREKKGGGGQQLSFSIPEREKKDDGGQLGDHDDNTPCVLSWGAGEELLVAASSLNLFATRNAAGGSASTCTWKKPLPNPAWDAAVSYDSSYIASASRNDRLVKVWRRINYGGDEVHFAMSYMRHPLAVTGVRWRRPFHADQTVDNVLYTFCADDVVRVWVAAEAAHCPHFVLWGQVDATASMGQGVSSRPWVTVLDCREVAAAVEKEVQLRDKTNGNVNGNGNGSGAEAALEHLIEVANKNPEVCLVFDGHGAMTAWALENVGTATQGMSVIFSLAHTRTESLDFPTPSASTDMTVKDGPPLEVHFRLRSYFDRKSGRVQVLLQRSDGRIMVYRAAATSLFSPTTSPVHHRLYFYSSLSGHSAPIRKIVRNFSGQAVLSRTAAGEAIVWKHVTSRTDTRLARQSVIPEKQHIRRISVLRKGRFVVLLCDDTISLWDCRQNPAVLLCRYEHGIESKPLCLIVMPRRNLKDPTVAHLATVTSGQQLGVVWEVDLPAYGVQKSPTCSRVSIREFCRFALKDAEGLAYVLPVDPAGASPIASGFLDVFARDVAISYTHTGRVDFWTARIDQHKDGVGWLSTCSTETAVPDPALVSGSTLKKAALVNSTRSQLTIWDIGGARLEYTEDFADRETVQDLDWTSTPDSQSILAVGFQYRVVLMSQMRYDYLNNGPAWASVREINIRDITSHPIGDSTWLSDGHLVIGTGHQLYVHDRSFGSPDSLVTHLKLPHRRDGSWDLFDVVQRLNGPLPVFHPQFISQCILAGKTKLVRRILMALHDTLKFHVEGEKIDDYLGIDLEDFYLGSSSVPKRTAKTYLERRQSLDARDDELNEDFSDDTASRINETLTRVAVPQLSRHEQIQLADIIECVGLVEKQRRSLDENGARFVLFFRQHALRKGRTNEIHLSWREINWAFHSTSQDILTDVVSRQYHGGMLWEDARESGMFMWLTDQNAIKSQFERIARNEYTKSEMKNPVDCSIFYLALRKKTVLQGLWRMANWNREQGATQKLLANNFDDPKHRTTALKNAYALMSKHRFGYAVALFLLADHLQDAVAVCLKQLKDLQLAVAITRVYEGDGGPVLRKLLEEEVLAIAAAEGNRWLASWAFWMLGRRDMAVRSLIAPVYTLLETPGHPDLMSRSFLTNDPALVVLYSQLRKQTLQTLRGASKVTPRVEWEFVLHSAKVYDRMGCDLLGLDLVRNWEFFRSDSSSIVAGIECDMNLLRLAGRRGSLVVDDMPSSPLASGISAAAAGLSMKTGLGAEQIKNTQTTTTTTATPVPVPVAAAVFQEPDANSLLDSFGF